MYVDASVCLLCIFGSVLCLFFFCFVVEVSLLCVCTVRVVVVFYVLRAHLCRLACIRYYVCMCLSLIHI